MTTNSQTLIERREKEYDLRLEVKQLQQQVAQAADEAALDPLLAQLLEKQAKLFDAEKARAEAEAADQTIGQIYQNETTQEPSTIRGGAVRDGSLVSGSERGGTRSGGTTSGADTTGLSVNIQLHMAQVPTATCQLFDTETHPLVVSEVTNSSSKTKRVRTTCYIEGYSARAVDTVEIPSGVMATFSQLPTLFPQDIAAVTELTRATLNVELADLDGEVELHTTKPIWLLARNSAPLSIKDPTTGQWNDLTRYLGAFVTPNAPSVMHFQRKVARHHPQGRLVGYQDRNVEDQVRAIFQAMKKDADITYVDSTVDFNPDESSATQRVRLPRETLDEQQANCIDGTLLFASLLEGISLNAAIVIVPGHAFVGWETSRGSDDWSYLETTKVHSHEFEKAVEFGNRRAKVHKGQWESSGNPQHFRQWSLRELRTKHGITPME